MEGFRVVVGVRDFQYCRCCRAILVGQSSEFACTEDDTGADDQPKKKKEKTE